MALSNLHDLYLHELKDIYNAENQILKALPKMIKSASNEKLKAAFEEHLEVTRAQVERLDGLFEKLDERAKGKTCKAMKGLIEEGKEMMEEKADPDVMDAGLIAAAQRIEHYEIAAYGTARTYAKMLGDEEAAKLLQKTLDEEGQTDKLLSKLAESVVNVQAKN
jgi:ferritin-like metal-binding protein YciE